MIAACYSMDLYCANETICSAQWIGITGETASECRKQTRKKGWKFIPGREVLCPKCKSVRHAAKGKNI